MRSTEGGGLGGLGVGREGCAGCRVRRKLGGGCGISGNRGSRRAEAGRQLPGHPSRSGWLDRKRGRRLSLPCTPGDLPTNTHTHPCHLPPQPPAQKASPELRSDLSYDSIRGLLRAFFPDSRLVPLTEPPSEDLGSLHPGALLFRAAGHPPSLPTMADALAHGADVNWVNASQENATPLIQATAAVRVSPTSPPLLPSPPPDPGPRPCPSCHPIGAITNRDWLQRV